MRERGQTTGHLRQALALATLLALRPLQARCYRGLDRLYARNGQQELASAELRAAMACYRAMDMVFWLQQDEMVPVQRSGGDEKPRENY